MKLRLRMNSLRLRLTHGDVERFRESGVVEESIDFGPGGDERFIYALVSAADALRARAVFEPYRITVYLPAAVAHDWTETDRVGLQGEQQVDDVRTLKILVEKDFTCLEPRSGGDDTDTFDHPARSCGDSVIGDQ